jgi:hypothetical protein
MKTKTLLAAALVGALAFTTAHAQQIPIPTAYFGPTAPAGKESNWVPTKAGGRFEVLFRFYGPEKPLFEKTWKLPDIEKSNN